MFTMQFLSWSFLKSAYTTITENNNDDSTHVMQIDHSPKCFEKEFISLKAVNAAQREKIKKEINFSDFSFQKKIEEIVSNLNKRNQHYKNRIDILKMQIDRHTKVIRLLQLDTNYLNLKERIQIKKSDEATLNDLQTRITVNKKTIEVLCSPEEEKQKKLEILVNNEFFNNNGMDHGYYL